MMAEAQAHGRPEPAFQPGSARQSDRPRIAIGLDTSSSIDPLTLSLFVAEAEGIVRRTGAEAHLLAFDEAVHEARRLDAAGWRGLRDMALSTGGGTDFAPVLEAAGGFRPSIAVILTDLDAPFGPAPAYPGALGRAGAGGASMRPPSAGCCGSGIFDAQARIFSASDSRWAFCQSGAIQGARLSRGRGSCGRGCGPRPSPPP
jgi:hypothetical protein